MTRARCSRAGCALAAISRSWSAGGRGLCCGDTSRSFLLLCCLSLQAADHWLFTLWPSVTAELYNALLLAPLLHTTITAPWWKRVVACDASLLGQGVCAARVSPTTAAGAASHSGVIINADPVVESKLNTPLLAARWSTIVSSRWRAVEHINNRSPLGGVPSIVHEHTRAAAVRLASCGRRHVERPFFVVRSSHSSSSSFRSSARHCWLASALDPADGPFRDFI